MPYVATINTPGYLPWDDEPPVFETPREAWEYLAGERRRQEDEETYAHGGVAECPEGPACPWAPEQDYSDTVAELLADDQPGSIYGDAPGSHSAHDLGLAYSVSWVEFDHEPMLAADPEGMGVPTDECGECGMAHR